MKSLVILKIILSVELEANQDYVRHIDCSIKNTVLTS